MPKKRGEFKSLMDRQKIAALVLAGKKNIEIAQELGISHQTVGRDLAEITRLWQNTRLNDVVNWKAEELERLNHMEGELWEAWHASKKEGKKRLQQWAEPGETAGTESSPRPVPIRVSVTTENGCGDPRIMNAILSIVQQRCKLLDLHQPIKR